MLPANIGTLLAGLRAGLAQSVLPKLDDPAAVRQLKAGLHLLERLSRCWDRAPTLLRADNEDIIATLANIGASVALPRYDADHNEPTDLDGINDAALRRLAAENRELRRTLEEVERHLRAAGDDPAAKAARSHLPPLYERMTRRDGVFVGDLAAD